MFITGVTSCDDYRDNESQCVMYDEQPGGKKGNKILDISLYAGIDGTQLLLKLKTEIV